MVHLCSKYKIKRKPFNITHDQPTASKCSDPKFNLLNQVWKWDIGISSALNIENHHPVAFSFLMC
jgi:hypothetical protein